MGVLELLAKIDELGIDPGDVDKRNKRRLIRLIETGGAAACQAGSAAEHIDYRLAAGP